MKILLVADPHISVPPSLYGGAERVVALYAEEFARLGHRVDLLAGPGSLPYGGRLHIHHAPSELYLSRAYRKIYFQFRSLMAAMDCDVVYNHARFDYLEALLKGRIPVLHCFHNPIDQAQIDFAEKRIGSNSSFHFVSNHQASHAHISAESYIIPNPVNTRACKAGDGNGGYLAFLGRLTYNKGVDVAISTARRCSRKLVIAGNVSSLQSDQNFFHEHVASHLDGDQIRWVGPVNDSQKQELLRNAEALLFPIRWDEPFGLVMVEALASGTPVISTCRASAPEVIEHGVTGWLCDPQQPSAEVFSEAVKHLPEIDRHACRQSAERHFDVRVLAPKVLNVLKKLSG